MPPDGSPDARLEGTGPGGEPSLRDARFLERAMGQWGDAVLRLALSQMRNRADAEDVFQDVFLRLLKDRTEFTGDEHLKAWLLRVTINRCHDLQRMGRKRAAEPLAGHEPAVEDAALDALMGSDVWEAVGALGADLRACVHLFYVEGYPANEIARLLGCEPATVRTRLHRARRALRAQLERLDAQATAAARAGSLGPDALEPWKQKASRGAQQAAPCGLGHDALSREGGTHG